MDPVFMTLTQESTGPVGLGGDRSRQITQRVSRSKTFIPSPPASSNLGTLICRNETIQLRCAVFLERSGLSLGVISVYIGSIFVPLGPIRERRAGGDNMADESRQHQQGRQRQHTAH